MTLLEKSFHLGVIEELADVALGGIDAACLAASKTTRQHLEVRLGPKPARGLLAVALIRGSSSVKASASMELNARSVKALDVVKCRQRCM